ncbi:hypothetical protein [Antrihabitans sp. YC2-6]|nr:hypothetical protein [Antrihabitans sp. YC2-6]
MPSHHQHRRRLYIAVTATLIGLLLAKFLACAEPVRERLDHLRHT